MDKIISGVGVPSYGSNSGTVAGSNTNPLSVAPGEAAGPIDPQSQKRSGYAPKRITRIDLNLATAATNKVFNISGTAFFFNYSSDATALVRVLIDNLQNDDFSVTPGTFISGVPFEKLYLTWTAQTGVTGELIVYQDQPIDRMDVR